MLKVVGFEGGPCGGKTSAIAYTADVARAAGIQTIVVPEVATEMIGELHQAGMEYQEIATNEAWHLQFQITLLHTIAARIKQVRKRHKYGADTLVLADRVDNAAYMDSETYGNVLRAVGYAEPPMHSLVDTILYFPTVAQHDPAKYRELLAHNSSRYESAEQAVATCNANRKSVEGHSDVWYLHEEDFERKLRYAANIALMGFRRSLDSQLTAV